MIINSIKSFVHDPHPNIIDEETFLQHLFNMFSSNSEANASELLENVEEMFPWYYYF